MWHLVTWLSGGLVSAGGEPGLDLRVLFQPQCCCDSVSKEEVEKKKRDRLSISCGSLLAQSNRSAYCASHSHEHAEI